MTTIQSTYTNDSWEQNTYSELPESPKLIQAKVKRVFHGDVFEGSGTATLLMCQTESGGAGYVATESVECVLAGKKGSFVIQHGATMGENALAPFGYIVPGSGTGELKGISGTCTWIHSDKESTFELEYRLTAQD